MERDIRWIQRFSNYKKALEKLQQSIEYIREDYQNEEHVTDNNQLGIISKYSRSVQSLQKETNLKRIKLLLSKLEGTIKQDQYEHRSVVFIPDQIKEITPTKDSLWNPRELEDHELDARKRHKDMAKKASQHPMPPSALKGSRTDRKRRKVTVSNPRASGGRKKKIQKTQKKRRR
jgi:hypothetical protein